MYCEDEAAESNDKSNDKSREFGVLGNVLRELQREELEYTETCQVEASESSVNEKMLKSMAQINETLKEIAETQKKILEEIQKNMSG
ncbi:hypothetical protein RSJ42_09120 [Methanosarcina hadiensis]|uniref:hypothetical protein n=1 Tax=Methanosarcina hadiensis TaxID=3078083 RepID=UPI0039772E0A